MPRKHGAPYVRASFTPAQREAKMEEAIFAVQSGAVANIAQLARHVDLKRSTLQLWLRQYPAFDQQIAGGFSRTSRRERGPVPDFPTFRQQCFGHPTPKHLQDQIDAVEQNDRTLILVPPDSGKTTTWAIEYPVYRICQDRNVRMVIICKNQEVAKKRLYAIKKRLSDHGWYKGNGWTSPIAEWGPFQPTEREKGALPWTQTLVYVSGVDSGEKDATVEVLGVGNQIQGARADLIILDDVADLKNQTSELSVANLVEWLGQEVNTRLSDKGKLIIIGTRVHEADLYAQLISEDTDWARDFARVIQPAILDEENKTVLWPEVWSYERLVKDRRNRMPRRNWELTYQQNAIGLPDAPFTESLIERVKDPAYPVGWRPDGMNVVMGVDPAVSGFCALSVVAIDRRSQERYILDCIARDGFSNTDLLKSFILEHVARYRADRCRIEKNFLRLTEDVTLRRELLAMGCQMEEEWTGSHNKYDPEWGVLSVAAAFDAGLYHLPWGMGSHDRMQPLIDELLVWRPVPQTRSRRKQDRVMSLWLAELSVRQFGTFRPGLPTHNEKLPPWASNRGVPRWVRKASVFTRSA